MNVKRILFFNLDRIGDVVRSSFLFRALRRAYPSAYIACVAAEPADQVLERDPSIDTVFVFPHAEIRALMKQQKTILHMAFPVFRLLEALRLHAFDLVINPYSEFGALAIRYLKPRYVLGRALDRSGAYISYGEEAATFYALMTNRQGARSRMECNFNEAYSHLLHALGIRCSGDDLAPRIYPNAHDEKSAQEFLSSQGVTNTDVVIGIQPGAFTKEKMWPIERFAEMLTRIQASYTVRFLMTGSLFEAKEYADTLRAVCPSLIVSAGVCPLMVSAALIKRCALFVSNDTGPMHIAAASGVPIVALFGKKRTVPLESRPWGEGHYVIAKERIEDITVDEVMAGVISQMNTIQSI